jgi:D-glycero-D-manno-heptose 1,7-bisphosphate phosphatase
MSKLRKTTSERRKPAVFFDRDGTLIHDRDYLSDPRGVKLLPGAARAVRLLKDAGYRVFVISNQSGVARGYFTLADARRVETRFKRLLAAKGARLDGYFFCPHHPKGTVKKFRRKCACRKPAPGMVREAAGRLPIAAKGSFVVGDKTDDVLLAARAGLKAGILVLTGYGRKSRRSLKSAWKTPVVANALAAARLILKAHKKF